MNRREFLTTAAAAGVISDGLMAAEPIARANPKPASSGFPAGFLWGAATAAHQVEGNNLNSDYWLLEQMKPSLFKEPSGDACDHYHRYRDDIRMLADLGLNTYRFSIEWARVEPEPGMFSNAEFDHYRRMLAFCHELGILPVLTLHHFSSPRWFAALGGWEDAGAADRFARYVEQVSKRLGDLIGTAVTINEPNTGEMLPWKGLVDMPTMTRDAMKAAAHAAGSDRFSALPFGDALQMQVQLIAGHHKAVAALKSGPGRFPVGPAIAMNDDVPFGKDTSGRDRKRAEVYLPWLDAAKAGSDFVGVQTYTRYRVDGRREQPPLKTDELTQMGDIFAPDALGQTIRYAHSITGLPVLVTENGIATEDDTRRVDFIRRAVDGVKACLADGIDVRGYIHWSLMDNFEWHLGYRPKFGLVAVDRSTFVRTIKPSAKVLGDIAKSARG